MDNKERDDEDDGCQNIDNSRHSYESHCNDSQYAVVPRYHDSQPEKALPLTARI